MSGYALVTGASRGIGKEIASLFAKDHIPLVLVARSINDLENFKKELVELYNIDVCCFEVDLSKENSCLELYNKIKNENIRVEYLINNAGFGDYGFFLDSDISKLNQMIDLNIKALVDLCYYFGNEMKKNKTGKIMNVASIASFFPGALMANYYASKSFVLSFSEALSLELKEYNISVTALYPGTTKTNFFKVANDKSNLLKKMKPALPSQVALYGYKKMMKNKTIAVYGFFNRCSIFFNRFAPRSLSRKIVYKVQRERDK